MYKKRKNGAQFSWKLFVEILIFRRWTRKFRSYPVVSFTISLLIFDTLSIFFLVFRTLLGRSSMRMSFHPTNTSFPAQYGSSASISFAFSSNFCSYLRSSLRSRIMFNNSCINSKSLSEFSVRKKRQKKIVNIDFPLLR